MLTKEEVKEIAMKNYHNGGDGIIECWTDDQIQTWIDEGGTKESLFVLFEIWKEEERAACCDSGYDPEIEKQYNSEFLDTSSESEEFYHNEHDFSSCTNGDYSPSNPWDAPGMSIRDFI